MKQLIYLSILLVAGLFLSACGGGEIKNTEQAVVGTQKMSGAEILQDANDYAEKQCMFKQREKNLRSNPKTKDFDRKMQELKLEKKKMKNHYTKKYKDFPEERVAFKRSVKLARQDSELCRNLSKIKISL